jgi:hypothetical protein
VELTFLSRLAEDIGNRYGDPGKRQKAIQPSKGPQPPGRFSFGTQLQGGPAFTDAYGAKPAPSLIGLGERYHAMIYAMVARNRNAVTRLPMRLMFNGSRGQGGPPARAYDAKPVTRRLGEKAVQEQPGMGGSAVDQIYEIQRHPILEVLDNPDPYGDFTREKFIGILSSYNDVFGAAYIVPEGNGWDWTSETDRVKGPPDWLWLLYPQYTVPVRMGVSPIVDHFYYFADYVPRQAAIWFRHNHSLRDAYGSFFSPTYASDPYNRQQLSQVTIYDQMLGLGPRPNMFATAKDPMAPPGENERKAFEIDLKRQQSGGYAGGVLVNTGAWEFKEATWSNMDGTGKEIALQDVYYMAAIFDQPATYYTVDTNINNLQAADEQHAKNGVEPRCKTIAGQFTQLVKRWDPRFFFQFDPALPEDDLKKAQTNKIYADMGAITINQINQDKQWPKVPYGDEPWIAGTLKQPSMITQAHEQELKTQEQAMQSQEQGDDIAADAHEHGKKMDIAQLKADNAKKERALLNQAEALLSNIQTELNTYAG